MCDRWKKRIKLNNHGSTLALAVATIAFVALLAATVISAASVNLALKRAQVYSDRAFYTAETAVDEVYTGLGVKSLNMLNSVFADVSSNLLETDLTTGMQFMVDNKTANLSMRQSFIQNMYKDLTGHKWSETNGESLVLHPTEKTSAIGICDDLYGRLHPECKCRKYRSENKTDIHTVHRGYSGKNRYDE